VGRFIICDGLVREQRQPAYDCGDRLPYMQNG